MQNTDNPGKACPKLTTVTGLETWNTELTAGNAGGSVYGKPKVNTTTLKGLFQGAAAPVSYTHLDVYKRQSST